MKTKLTSLIWIGSMVLSPYALANTDENNRQLQQDITRYQKDSEQYLQQHIQQPTTDTNQSLSINQEQLLQDPELLHWALISAVVLEQVEGVRILYPLFIQAQIQDETLDLLAQALLAKTDGQYKKAITAYQQALNKEPHQNVIRLNLAKVLFDNHQDKSAKYHFDYLKNNESDGDIQQIINAYLNAIEQRYHKNASIQLGWHYDSNLNNANQDTILETDTGYWEFPAPYSAYGVNYSADISKNWVMTDNFSITSQLQFTGKNYKDQQEYNDIDTSLGLGIDYQTAKAQFSFLPIYNYRRQGGEPYSWEGGVQIEGKYWSKPNQQWIASIDYLNQNHHRQTFLDGNFVSTSVNWLYVKDNSQYYLIGSDFSKKDAQDDSESYRRHALKINWIKQWNDWLYSSLYGQIAERHYQQMDIFNIDRKDKEYLGAITLWTKPLSFDITPKLTLIAQKSDSNHHLYHYDKYQLYLQFSKEF